MHALLQEFCSLKSSAMGLPLSFHHEVKFSFESETLPVFLDLTLGLLSLVMSGGQEASLVPGTVALAESILSWDFFDGQNFEMDASFGVVDHNSSSAQTSSRVRKLPAQFARKLVDMRVLDLFFQLHGGLHDEYLSHKSLQCLIVLAGLPAKVFGGDEQVRTKYLERYVSGYLQIVDK